MDTTQEQADMIQERLMRLLHGGEIFGLVLGYRRHRGEWKQGWFVGCKWDTHVKAYPKKGGYPYCQVSVMGGVPCESKEDAAREFLPNLIAVYEGRADWAWMKPVTVSMM